VFLTTDVEETHLPRVHDDESNEVIGLFPYLGPELIEAILKREGIFLSDLQEDSESATDHSYPTLRFQSAVNEKPVRVPSGRKAAWLRCTRLFATVGRLTAPWFP
jgi:hypothetical protein